MCLEVKTKKYLNWKLEVFDVFVVRKYLYVLCVCICKLKQFETIKVDVRSRVF